MSTFKRCISLLLVMLILVGIFAPAAQAAPAEETASVNTDNVTIEGTNGFGNLLSQEIAENQEEVEAADEGYPGGYTVTDLVIEGNTATVIYDTMEEAILVVALYTEDGMQMVTSTTATVTPDSTEATLTFEGEMPEYFMTSAYLLDGYDFSPLCAAYDTPMYTREMQELLASTVEDYDPERVLNLDEDDSTNFAVYAESTIVIIPVEGFNTVTSVNNENMTYVINNADKQMTALSEGDVFVYPYGENELLIVKIAGITVDGTTVTITGSDLEMEEVFSHVKVESDSTSADMTVIEGTGEEGITYVGLTDSSDAVNPNAVDGGVKAKLYHEFGIEKTFSEDHIGGDNGGETPNTIKLKGTLKIGLEFKFEYYVSWTRQYVKFTAKTGVELDIGVTGKLNKRACKLPSFGVSPIIGVYIGIKPQIEFQASAELAWEASYSFTLGFSYSNDKGKQNLTTSPKITSEVKLEGTLFFGIDLHPTIEVIGGTVIDVDLTGLIGFEINGKSAGSIIELDDANVVHDCFYCIQGDVQFKAAVSATIKFLKCKDLSVDLDIFEIKCKLTDYYYSHSKGTGALTTCPYISYKIVFEVRNGIDLLMPNTEILKKDGTSLGKTNDLGVLIAWLPLGKTTVKALAFGEDLKKTINVTADDAGSKVVLKFGISVSAKDYLSKAENAVDYGSVINSGQCGANGSNVKWTLYGSGLMEISGTGAMEDYGNTSSVPWDQYRANITSLRVCEGVTFLGMFSFVWCVNLESIDLADSVVSIGHSAFAYCEKLKHVELPHNLRTLGISVFNSCKTLKSIAIPKTLVSMEEFTFYFCSSLRDVYYEGNEEQWNKIDFGYMNHSLTGATIHYNHTGWSNAVADRNVAPQGVYSGEYTTEVNDNLLQKSAFFSKLAPHEQYVLLAMVSIEVDEPLAVANLLAIDQGVATEDGTLSFQYIQRTPCEVSYVVACGASNKNLNEAVITFPEMTEDSELHVVNPTVEYDGKTLTEGLDYIITGTVAYAEPGEYTCCVRGIYNYTGSVECVYVVEEAQVENPFTDVTPSDYYYTPVLWAVDKGITNGMSETEFAPEDTCKRSQVVTFLWRAAGEPKAVTRSNPFVDVKSTDYFYEAVLWAVEKGITNGMDDTHFEPDGVCKRSQVVTFLYRSFGEPPVGNVVNPFTDVPTHKWYATPVLWAVKEGITNGMSENSFAPENTCTRAQVVTFLYRAYN